MPDNDLEIETLIQLARDDRSALGRLLERYRPFLTLDARRQIDPGRAEECDVSGVVQHTLAEASEDFTRFQGASEGEFAAWIRRIHHHNILDRVRRRRPEVSIPKAPDDTASFHWWEPAADQTSPSQRLIKGERALRLAALLQALPDAQCEAVRLRHLEGWPVERIARHLNRSVAATAGLLKRGLHALRTKMAEESWF